MAVALTIMIVIATLVATYAAIRHGLAKSDSEGSTSANDLRCAPSKENEEALQVAAQLEEL